MVDKPGESVGVSAGNGINRRDFLKMGAAGVAGASLLGVAGCGGGGGSQSGGPVEFTFAMAPDDSGVRQKQIDDFNQQNEGKYKLNYREVPSGEDPKHGPLLRVPHRLRLCEYVPAHLDLQDEHNH